MAPGQVAGNIVQLKYYITVPTGATLSHKVNGAVSFTDITASGAVAGSGSATASNTIELDYKYVTGTTAPTATSESISVPVIAWLDADNDNVVDANEYQQSRTVGFKKYSEVVPTVAITTPAVADSSVKATVSVADINVEQLGVTATAKGDFDVTVAVTGTGVVSGSATTKADGVFTKALTTNLAAADVVSARATYRSVDLGTAAVTSTVAARTIIQPTASVVAGNNAVVSGNVVRTNSAFAVAATIKDTAATAAVKAGVAVKAAITTTAALSTTKTLSINGTVYNGTVAIPASIDLVSDANGLATVNFVTTGFVQSEAITVVYTAQNFSATVAVDLQDATYTVASTAVGGVHRSIAEGGSTTIEYSVADQFGVAIGAGARLKFVVGYTTSATSYAVLSGGKASITVADTTANVVSAINVDATLETQDAATSNWAELNPTVVATRHVVNVTATAVAFDVDPTAVSANLDTNVALNAVSVNNAGAPVTISATGVTFTVGGKEYANTVTVFTDANGTIPAVDAKSTVAGAKTVTFTSGAASKTATLTINAAANNSGVTLTVSAPATVVPGQTFTVTGKLVDKWGNPVAVTNSLTTPTANSADRGFSVTYTGPGFVIGGSLPTATNASGEFSFQVLTGAADSGTATVTATYDVDGAYASITSTSPATSAAAISKTASIAIAAPAAPEVKTTIVGVTKSVRVRVENAKGEEVEIKFGSKTVRVAIAGTNSKLWVINTTKGKKSVKVYVDGDLVAVKTVTVK
jgi:hypothetical protein